MLAGITWDAAPAGWDAAPGVWDVGTVDRTDSIRLTLAEARGIFSEILLADAFRIRLDELVRGSSNILTGDALRLARAWDRRTLCITDWPAEVPGAGDWTTAPPPVAGPWTAGGPAGGLWNTAAPLPREREGCSS